MREKCTHVWGKCMCVCVYVENTHKLFICDLRFCCQFRSLFVWIIWIFMRSAQQRQVKTTTTTCHPHFSNLIPNAIDIFFLSITCFVGRFTMRTALFPIKIYWMFCHNFFFVSSNNFCGMSREEKKQIGENYYWWVRVLTSQCQQWQIVLFFLLHQFLKYDDC